MHDYWSGRQSVRGFYATSMTLQNAVLFCTDEMLLRCSVEAFGVSSTCTTWDAIAFTYHVCCTAVVGR